MDEKDKENPFNGLATGAEGPGVWLFFLMIFVIAAPILIYWLTHRP